MVARAALSDDAPEQTVSQRHRPQHRHNRARGLRVQHALLGSRQVRVEACEIADLEYARHTQSPSKAELDDGVDIGSCGRALFEQCERLTHQRPLQPIADETRQLLPLDGGALANLEQHVAHRSDRLIRGFGAAHDFDERHQGRRVEIVCDKHTIRPAGGRRQLTGQQG
jgi:hypothetical protein